MKRYLIPILLLFASCEEEEPASAFAYMDFFTTHNFQDLNIKEQEIFIFFDVNEKEYGVKRGNVIFIEIQLKQYGLPFHREPIDYTGPFSYQNNELILTDDESGFRIFVEEYTPNKRYRLTIGPKGCKKESCGTTVYTVEIRD